MIEMFKNIYQYRELLKTNIKKKLEENINIHF